MGSKQSKDGEAGRRPTAADPAVEYEWLPILVVMIFAIVGSILFAFIVGNRFHRREEGVCLYQVINAGASTSESIEVDGHCSVADADCYRSDCLATRSGERIGDCRFCVLDTFYPPPNSCDPLILSVMQTVHLTHSQCARSGEVVFFANMTVWPLDSSSIWTHHGLATSDVPNIAYELGLNALGDNRTGFGEICGKADHSDVQNLGLLSFENKIMLSFENP